MARGGSSESQRSGSTDPAPGPKCLGLPRWGIRRRRGFIPRRVTREGGTWRREGRGRRREGGGGRPSAERAPRTMCGRRRPRDRPPAVRRRPRTASRRRSVGRRRGGASRPARPAPEEGREVRGRSRLGTVPPAHLARAAGGPRRAAPHAAGHRPGASGRRGLGGRRRGAVRRGGLATGWLVPLPPGIFHSAAALPLEALPGGAPPRGRVLPGRGPARTRGGGGAGRRLFFPRSAAEAGGGAGPGRSRG